MHAIDRLPSPYKNSKSSAYRLRIAAQAKPLPDKVAACTEMGRTIFKGTPNPHGLLIDIPAYLEAINRFIEIATKHGIELPGIDGSIPSTSRWENFFSDNGVLFDGANSRLFTGPIIATRRFDSVDVFVAALEDRQSGAAILLPDRSSDGGNSCRIILDAVSFLEEAVFRINLMRFNKLEPLSSILARGAKPNIIRGRLRKVGDLSDINGFRSILSDLQGDSDNANIFFNAFGTILIFKFMADMIKSCHSEDEIEHTINLFNLIARSSVITQLTVNREGQRIIDGLNGGQRKYDESAIMEVNQVPLDFVGWVANIAYGDPFFRICEIQMDGVHSETESGVFFKRQGMPRILTKLGIPFTPETSMSEIARRLFSFLCASKEQLQSVAREILDEYFEHYTGKTFDGTHPGLAEVLREVNEATFLTKDDLPIVSEVWKTENVI